MTKNLDKEGLSSIVDNYQLFYIDLWGVVHNGVSLHVESKIINDLEMPERHWEVGSHYLLFARARVASPVSPYTGHPRSAIKKGCELLCGAIAACVKAFCNALAACRKAIVNGYASFLVRYAAATAVAHALLTLTYLSRVSDRQG